MRYSMVQFDEQVEIGIACGVEAALEALVAEQPTWVVEAFHERYDRALKIPHEGLRENALWAIFNDLDAL